eukprot:TRINITY_DN28209_c1_g1_i1.p1 TRINITY_DN28209_c1_g1~~TRINITY_DN28209_c1_g1_i1.p1  ORF type:complete len:241 (+),score=103.45 TRINITY_DN28209_c1_g1_i1:38-724(+)
MFARRGFQFLRAAGKVAQGSRGLATVPVAHAGRSNKLMAALAASGVAVGLYNFDNIVENNFSAAAASAVPFYGVPGTKNERTFIAIKPDGVHRYLIGEVVSRFEKKGLKLVAIKVIHPTKEFAEKHYADLSARPFFPGLVNYFSSGPVIAMVWEGHNAIKNGRKLVGATNPDDALPGSIRGDFALQTGRNIIHGSDGPDSAKDEISLWFTEKEVVGWDTVIDKWVNEK